MVAIVPAHERVATRDHLVVDTDVRLTAPANDLFTTCQRKAHPSLWPF
jgi:hypothetical protein